MADISSAAPDFRKLCDEQLPELRAMFERILCVARSSGGPAIGNIQLADRLIDAVVSWSDAALAQPEPEGVTLPEAQRDVVIHAVTEALGNAYDCLRVWEAWHIGTMGEDDFSLVSEDTDRVAEIADAAIEAMRIAAALAQPEPEGPTDEELPLKIDELLDGIDRDECDPKGGWWETSDGAKFGRIKLRELKELIAQYQQSRPAIEPAPTAD